MRADEREVRRPSRGRKLVQGSGKRESPKAKLRDGREEAHGDLEEACSEAAAETKVVDSSSLRLPGWDFHPSSESMVFFTGAGNRGWGLLWAGRLGWRPEGGRLVVAGWCRLGWVGLAVGLLGAAKGKAHAGEEEDSECFCACAHPRLRVQRRHSMRRCRMLRHGPNTAMLVRDLAS